MCLGKLLWKLHNQSIIHTGLSYEVKMLISRPLTCTINLGMLKKLTLVIVKLKSDAYISWVDKNIGC